MPVLKHQTLDLIVSCGRQSPRNKSYRLTCVKVSISRLTYLATRLVYIVSANNVINEIRMCARDAGTFTAPPDLT